MRIWDWNWLVRQIDRGAFNSWQIGLSAPLALVFACAWPAQAQVNATRELKMQASLAEAFGDVIVQAGDDGRNTFFPVAVWQERGLGRGSALLTARRPHPQFGECLEFAISFVTDDEQPQYADFTRAACRKSPGEDYQIRQDVAVTIDERRLARARSFLPPAGLKPGDVWRIANSEKLTAHSSTAAMVLALNSSPASLPVTRIWEAANNRGALHVYASSRAGCLKVISKPEIPASSRPPFAAEYCRMNSDKNISGGWARTEVKAPPADEMVTALTHIDATLKRATEAGWWNGITVLPTLAKGDSPTSSPRADAPVSPTSNTGSSAASVRGQATAGSETSAAQRKSLTLSKMPAIRIDQTCAPTTPVKAPWGNQLAGGGMPALAGYRESVAHALRNLKIAYGNLSAEQSEGLDRLWAPFFDHPTKDAHAWFSRLNPLLDQYLSTVAEIEALFPEYREAMADVLIASTTASQTYFQVHAPKAQVLAVHLEEAEQRLRQTSDQIAALGDAPNPLAGKCAAQARHRKAIGPGLDVMALLKQTKYLVALDGKQSQNPDGGMRSAGDSHVRAVFMGAANEPTYARRIEEESPLSTLTWNKNTFQYSSKTRHFDAPCTSVRGGHSSQYATTLQGELSPDGLKILNLWGSQTERFCENDKTGNIKETREHLSLPEAVATLYQGKPVPNAGEQIEIIYTAPHVTLPSDIANWQPRDGDMFVRFASFLHHQKPLNFCGILVKDPSCDSRFNAWVAGKKWAGPEKSTLATGTKKEDPASPAASAGSLSADDAAQATQEAIHHHETLATQIQQNANRWAEDAKRENDPKRKEELQKRALEIAANAQAERDIAATLRTGSLVRTRTDWDRHQSQAITEKIIVELDQFSEESQRLERINKYLLADQGHASEGMQQKISDALKSPQRAKELAKLEEEAYVKVYQRKAQELYWREKEKELADWELQRPAELAKQTANAAVMLTAMAVPGAGPLAIGYGLGMGYIEGGPSGAIRGGVGMYSPYLDATIATLEGAHRGGLWGAVKGGGTTVLMNKFMGGVAPRLQKAMHAMPNAPKIPASKQPAVDVEIHTAEQRMKYALENARTPEQQQLVRQQYKVIELRKAIKQERLEAELRADQIASKARRPDGSVDTNHPEYKRAVREFEGELARIDKKYSAEENRDLLHNEAIETAGLTENQIKLSGGKPKNALSDFDVTAASYEAGKKYIAALTRKGVAAVEYGDRWVLSNDTTVWKPTASAKAGSSAFEAETSFGASGGSDKFATASGQKITKGEASGDRAGGVIDNIKKAGEAGLGNTGSKDWHVIGKSTDKAIEIAGSDADALLRKQASGLRNHQPESIAGITTLGASPEVKARQLRAFEQKAREAMSNAFKAANRQSQDYLDSLVAARDTARKSGDMKRVSQLQEELALIRSSNGIAVARVADVAPGVLFNAKTQPATSPASRPSLGDPVSLPAYFAAERLRAGSVDLATKGADPALGDLGERCKAGAKRLEEKIKAAKAGSDEARYLVELKAILERGASDPADAINQVRTLSGMELAVVLRQLGVVSKR
ncbi:MAG: hypothetical protein EG825_11650 [Rhodocyclaceae bacterium]|nr:hypothetical protein [Rhodocyclaceae bacterium]